MFSIHDVRGVKVSGPLETINKTKPAQPRPVTPRGGFWDEPPQHSPVLAFTQQHSGQRYGRAEELYRRMLKINVNEPVIHAHQIMSSYVYTVDPADSVLDAWKWMAEYGVGQMPVVDKDSGLVSMIDDESIRHLLIGSEHDIQELARVPVSQIMPAEVLSADPVASVRRIARALADYRQRAMPIRNDSDRLVGIISRGDLLRAFAADAKLNFWS